MLNSIKSRILVAYVALIIAITVSLTVFGYSIIQTRLFEIQKQTTIATSALLSKHIGHEFIEKQRIFEVISGEDEISTYRRKYQKSILLSYFRRYTGEFSTLSFLTPDGMEEVRVEYGLDMIALHDMSDVGIIREAMSNPGEVYSGPAYRNSGSGTFMAFAIALRSYFDKNIGIVYGEIPIDDLFDHMDLGSFLAHESQAAFIRDAEGSIIYGITSIGKSTFLERSRNALGKLESPITDFSKVNLPTGNFYASSTPVTGIDFDVIIAMPEASLRAAASKLTGAFVSITLIILAVGVIIALNLSGEVNVQLRDLRSTIKQLAGGNLAVRIKGGRLDEVQAIGQDLNTMASQLQHAMVDLEHSRDELVELTKYLVYAKEEERRFIARELHDELGQAMTALMMDVSFAEEMLSDDESEIRDRMKAISNQISSTIGVIQNITSQLRPIMLDELGIGAAVEWYIQEFKKRNNIKCNLNVDIMDSVFSDSVTTSIYRILQEALTNVARHSGAKNVDISINQSDGRISIRIADDGKGISTDHLESTKSFGLIGMRERVKSLGGQIQIDTESAEGTTINISIPYEAAHVN